VYLLRVGMARAKSRLQATKVSFIVLTTGQDNRVKAYIPRTQATPL